MGSLYRKDLNKYKNYFKQAATLLGIDVQYQYLIKRNTESQSGESIYSGLSEPITQSVIIEQGNPKIDSLKHRKSSKQVSLPETKQAFFPMK